jgi:DNA repair exonuclease SbcCD ATPase subunit
MATDRLETAVRNFQHVNQMVERYTRLCRAYVSLSERFHQLDVDHMTLKGQVVPLLKALKDHQAKLKAIETEKAEIQARLDQQTAQHRQELQQLTKTYEERLQTLSNHIDELQPLEQLLNGETNHELSIAEEQMELVETTFLEIEQDSSPDLSIEEKALLAAYQADPNAFLVAAADTPAGTNPVGTPVEAEEPVASLWNYYYDDQVPDGLGR